MAIGLDVHVYHKGIDITEYVVGYTREAKICTGIGTLQVIVDPAIPRTFTTFDEIGVEEDIYDAPKYYINSVSNTQSSDGENIILDCQDGSKRIVDYFVTDTFTEGSLVSTRKWINKFMTLAGVDYVYENAGAGGNVVPGSVFGMTSAYDQILQLLQQSGWYMRFNTQGKAVIGQLGGASHDVKAIFTESNISSFGYNKNDKMLRNRAVVWGGVDPNTLKLIRVDTSRNTPWNYDSKDVRAVALGNSTIPDKATAKGIARLLLNEFAQITLEKTLDAPGAFGIELGDHVGVQTRLWSGISQVTTVAVSMSKDGLVTSLILDERCPRLFAFWYPSEAPAIPQEYVYIGTDGDGVWKKDLAYLEEWKDWSDGLENKHITDLYIKDGTAVCVDEDGLAYKTSTYENYWSKLGLSHVTTASGIVYGSLGDTFKARACVLDKVSNTVKLIVDNNNRKNIKNYIANTTLASGITLSGESNSWLVEYSPLGIPINDWQISVSGEYNAFGFDIENDGINDFASVFLGIQSSGVDSSNYNFGYRTNSINIGDSRVQCLYSDGQAYPVQGTDYYKLTLSATVGGRLDTMTFYDDERGDGNRVLVYMYYSSGMKLYHKKFTYVSGLINVDTTISTSITATSTRSKGLIKKIDDDTYVLYYIFNATTLVKYTWTISTNTLVNNGTVATFTSSASSESNTIIGDKIYSAYTTNSFSTDGSGNGIGSCTAGIDTFDASTESLSTTEYLTLSWGAADPLFRAECTTPLIFPRGESGYQAAIVYHELYGTVGSPTLVKVYGILINNGTADTNIYLDSTYALWQVYFNGLSQSGASANYNHMVYHGDIIQNRSSGINYYVFSNGDSMWFAPVTYEEHKSTSPGAMTPSWGNSTDDEYISVDGSDLYLCNSNTLKPKSLISFYGYTSVFPIWNRDSIDHCMYFLAIRSSDSQAVIIGSYDGVSVIKTIDVELSSWASPSGYTYSWLAGNFLFYRNSSTLEYVYYFSNTSITDPGGNYLVLKRDGNNFVTLEVSALPDRLDVSNPSRLLTGERTINSVNQYGVWADEIDKVTFLGLLGSGIMRDFRFSPVEAYIDDLDTTIRDTILYTTGSGINYLTLPNPGSTQSLGSVKNLMTFSGYIQNGLLLDMIEASNTMLPYQYIFASYSGGFIQQDPFSDVFEESSKSLPSSRVTCIRMDDKF